MATMIEMPKLSLTMTEGTVIHWLKQAGDPVKQGEPIVEVSSDKEVSELGAPEDGVLLEIKVTDGETVACHTVLGYIGQEGEKIGNEHQTVASLNGQGSTAETADKTKVKISPVARRIAIEAGLDVETIIGTGPGGRITKEDVEKAIEMKEVASSDSVMQEAPISSFGSDKIQNVEKILVSGMRKVIASRMHQSLEQSAQLTHHMRADITELLRLKSQTETFVEKKYNRKYTLTDFIALATVLALEEHKQVNSAWIDDEIYIYSDIHLGIAVDVENGLVVPVIRQAQTKSLSDLSRLIQEVVVLAKTKRLKSDQMKGSTFTISNLGTYDVEYFTPILNPPETGILGIGAARETPVFVGDEIKKRTLLPMSFTFNHQVLDGAPAAEFLRTVKKYLESPINLLL